MKSRPLPLETAFAKLPLVSLAEIKEAIVSLSPGELAQLRRLLDDLLEDDLEFTPEFESTLKQSEEEKTKGLRPRARQG